MLVSKFCRYFSTSLNFRSVEKSLLATLRKQTGYSFSNCKKALEISNNNLAEAEKWLQQQAQTLGWSKATKLEGRQTSQGLIGVLVKNNLAALVEVNCETDFVARNEKFKDMVELATKTCFNFISKQNLDDDPIHKVYLNNEKLRNLLTTDNKPLSDHLALMIGNLGENAILKRALCLGTSTDNIQLHGYVHPAPTQLEADQILHGKYAAIVALKSNNPPEELTPDLGKNICQHIVGMNPKKIGKKDVDAPAKNIDDEVCLIHQEFLADPTYTVQDVLTKNGMEIVDFVRFECGEAFVDEDVIGREIRIETIQTCQ